MQSVEYARIDYGNCPCRGLYDLRRVEVRMTVGGRVVILTNVPQGVCRWCASRVYKTEVLERIESLMKGGRVQRHPG